MSRLHESRILKPRNNFVSAKTIFNPATHCIFDLDGTILDTEDIYEASLGKIVQEYGKEYTKEVKLAMLGTQEDDTARIIVEHLDLPVHYKEFSRRAKAEQLKVMHTCSLMPGAEKLIRHLARHGVPMAVATSSSVETYSRKIMRHKHLFAHFSHVVTGSSDPEVKNGKPAPDIFLLAAKRFSDFPDPSQCLVFEDAPNGVTGAIRAGMQVVMTPDDLVPHEKRRHATHVVKTLHDFRPEEFGLPPFPLV